MILSAAPEGERRADRKLALPRLASAVRRMRPWSLAFCLVNLVIWLAVTYTWLVGLSRDKVLESWTWPEQWREWLAATSILWYVIATVIAGAAGWARKNIGATAKWRLVKELLDTFRDELFGESGGVHANRVTLFRHVGWKWAVPRCTIHPRPHRHWCWPLQTGGWLVPVVRSAHTTQRSCTAFRAPRENPAGAEGVAGAAWAERGIIRQEELPNLLPKPPEQLAPEDERIEEYAMKARVDVDWVRERVRRTSSCARSFYAIPVRVRGNDWGVIVVDSAEAQLPKPRTLRHLERTMARLLAKMLEDL